MTTPGYVRKGIFFEKTFKYRCRYWWPPETGGLNIPDKPLHMLNKSIGNRVIVELRNRKEYRGVLVGYDPHMNLVLKTAEEINNDEISRKLELVIVRGDNVVYISP